MPIASIALFIPGTGTPRRWPTFPDSNPPIARRSSPRDNPTPIVRTDFAPSARENMLRRQVHASTPESAYQGLNGLMRCNIEWLFLVLSGHAPDYFTHMKRLPGTFMAAPIHHNRNECLPNRPSLVENMREKSPCFLVLTNRLG